VRNFVHISAVIASLALAAGPAPAEPPPPYVPKLSPRPSEKLPPSTPMDEAAAELGKIKQCPAAAGWFEAKCAIVHLHEADKILRRSGATYDDAPQLWWAIFEGLGRSFATLGEFQRAFEFFSLASHLRGLPAQAFEETAYNLGAVLYALGRTGDALERLDSLFKANSDWLVRSESDPALEKLRETPEWRKMAEAHYERRKQLGLPPHALTKEKPLPGPEK